MSQLTTILDKKGREYLKTGLLYPLRPQYRTLAATPSPLPPMLISPGFTSFILSSNIDQGGGWGAFLNTNDSEFVSCDCSKSRTRIFLTTLSKIVALISQTKIFRKFDQYNYSFLPNQEVLFIYVFMISRIYQIFRFIVVEFIRLFT